MIGNIPIQNDNIMVPDVDTITLYLNPTNQKPFYEYILAIKPNRIIFNPGTENEELEILAKEAGIETMEACTLVLLSTSQY
jgi:predicted CoA-binding protein